MVDSSECLLAILGKNVPPIASQEMVRAFERRRAGASVEFWMFLDPRKKTRRHEDFLQRIKNEFGEEIVFAEYQSDLEFQSAVAMTLVEYVFKRLRRGTVLGGGGQR